MDVVEKVGIAEDINGRLVVKKEPGLGNNVTLRGIVSRI